MKITIEFDEEKLIREVMENYPEYSSPSLQCKHFNYNRCMFEFYDSEEDQRYDVRLTYATKMNKDGTYNGDDLRLPGLKRGLKVLISILPKLPGLNINVGNFQDAGEWDADCTDALVQCAIFGEVRYG